MSYLRNRIGDPAPIYSSTQYMDDWIEVGGGYCNIRPYPSDNIDYWDTRMRVIKYGRVFMICKTIVEPLTGDGGTNHVGGFFDGWGGGDGNWNNNAPIVAFSLNSPSLVNIRWSRQNGFYDGPSWECHHWILSQNPYQQDITINGNFNDGHYTGQQFGGPTIASGGMVHHDGFNGGCYSQAYFKICKYLDAGFYVFQIGVGKAKWHGYDRSYNYISVYNHPMFSPWNGETWGSMRYGFMHESTDFPRGDYCFSGVYEYDSGGPGHFECPRFESWGDINA